VKVTAPLSRLKTNAVRIGIYLPVGVMARLQAELTGLNRARVEGLINDLIDRGARQLGASEDADRPPTSDSSPTGNKRTGPSTVSNRAFDSARVTIPDDPSRLPIKSYDSLGVDEIGDRLDGLTQTDLARLYGYERAHQDRNTVVDAIEARILDLPIPAYDALKASEILQRLDGLDAEELELLQTYESATKRRSTVISKIESLLQ
jgi:hypothetical protein